jgi:hypothetical protein
MSPETARCFALIVAAQARIAGMSAENQLAAAVGNSPPYGEAAFNNEAGHMEQIAQQVINQ